MTEQTPADTVLDEQAIASLAARLEAYATGLTAHERRVLETIILAAMDPVERMRWRDPAAVLDPREEAFLNALADEYREE